MKCSLIIPAFNSAATIEATLRSSLHQSIMRADYEVIVVNDGSNDETAEIVARYPVRLISQKNAGPAAARNNGARVARGDVIIFTDSDCELDYRFIEKISEPILTSAEIDGVQGSYRTRQRGFIARFIQTEIETRYNKIKKNRYIDFIGTYAAAYRRKIFLRHNGFDTGFLSASGEDAEFSYRLQENNHKLVFCADAFVYHHHPEKLGHYLRVKFFRGYWRVRLHKMHPRKMLDDSYTTIGVKAELLSVPLTPAVVLLGIFDLRFLLFLIPLVLLFVWNSIPYIRIFRRMSYSRSFLITPVLLVRTYFIFFGVLWGVIRRV